MGRELCSRPAIRSISPSRVRASLPFRPRTACVIPATAAFIATARGGLTTGRGEPVLDVNGRPICCRREMFRVGASGAVSVAGAWWATVGVFSFPRASSSSPRGTNRYAAPPNVKAVLSQDASVHEGAIESANQDVIQGTLDLIVMQRQAEMMQKALTTFM